MNLELKGKRVLVTGASKGLGLGIVKAFLAEGATVVAVARHSTPELDATEATFIAADLSDPDGPRQMVRAAGPHLDVLVNNVGGGNPPAAAFDDPLDGDDEVWADLFALNLSAAVRTIRAALPALTQARGAIVNISSDAALRPGAAPMPYAAAKAALNSLSRGLAEKLAPQGVRVNTVTPSGVRGYSQEGPDGYVANLAKHLGMEHSALLEVLPSQGGMLTGRLAEPEEVAPAVLLLASPVCSSAIGENWTVTAGAVKAV
ncbi:SDR family NAD(P)-dependent oxidoreductase [Actinoplanes sp. NPDC051470]|uniref:SDR family NAD(P)-dependent oxidoreductase n=1 Tax=unclassified Actinoplanes TaxID=2626549 RepID=UPI0024A49ED0|nr:SDR family NAD(P)-dependent oxidoreductase [Actinoplanes sp. NBRC 103695]GLZ01266.1 short-chain dehydrogenase [Actinoplanes sp. NBRC 103695]